MTQQMSNLLWPKVARHSSDVGFIPDLVEKQIPHVTNTYSYILKKRNKRIKFMAHNNLVQQKLHKIRQKNNIIGHKTNNACL